MSGDQPARRTTLTPSRSGRIAETGPKLISANADDTKVSIDKLAGLGVVTADDVADLKSLCDEITNERAPEPQARITAAGNRMLGRDSANKVAVTIAGIAIASAAKSPTNTH